MQLRDHPRMCGEHKSKTRAMKHRAGSSPHVRGAPRKGTGAPSDSGIIPACAGSTLNRSGEGSYLRDHPRMCGEHVGAFDVGADDAGSSPHVRGARRTSSNRFVRRGIIPACAGSTSSLTLVAVLSRDHPRMCGEHPRQRYFTTVQPGSSPHVRGAHDRNVSLTRLGGIIPACAGSTSRTSSNL